MVLSRRIARMMIILATNAMKITRMKRINQAIVNRSVDMLGENSINQMKKISLGSI